MLNVVVVEDEYTIRTGLCRMITRLSKDYRVVGSAEDGYEGMLLIKQCSPDLAICDIKMGKHDGLNMIRSLREINTDCRFVILSGYSEFPYAQQAIKLGVQDYLLKPVMVDQLEELLRETDRLVNSEKDSEAAENPEYSQLIATAVQKIETHYYEKLALSELAAELGVTPEYLSTQFTRETGVNFVYYLKKHRIRKASELLLGSGKKIYEVAFAVGYEDPQYFCRVFKEITGVSPKSYLRSNTV